MVVLPEPPFESSRSLQKYAAIQVGFCLSEHTVLEMLTANAMSRYSEHVPLSIKYISKQTWRVDNSDATRLVLVRTSGTINRNTYLYRV